MKRNGWLPKWALVAAAIGAFGLAGCEDAASPPATVPDSSTGSDVAAEGTDGVGSSDSSADSLASDGGDVAGGNCAAPCVDKDNNSCTYAVCEAGACVTRTLADATACEDGDPCTAGESCQSGACVASTAPGSNSCGCSTTQDCASLDDGLTCNGQFFCDKSSFPYTCKVNPATLPPCESQTPPNDCLVAGCAEPAASGGKAQCLWQPAADGKACNDGNPLTEGDVCFAGQCQAGLFIGSCQQTSDCGKYEDGNQCNGLLFCNKAKGQCQLNPATIVTCPTVDDTTCRQNTCAPATGQCSLVAATDSTPCEDGNSCTAGEVCSAGICTASTNICACAADADCGAYEDGNLCNGTLYCNLQSGTCQLNPATVVQCGDAAEPCQGLTCEPTTGACKPVADPDGTPCNADNTLCTLADACKAGQCKAGTNLCKCASTEDCGLFEDPDLCNGQLYCNLQGGVCEVNPSTVVTCDDGLETACSKQACVPLSGECTAVAINQGGGCDDGNSCSLGDTCDAGQCQAGTAACACATDSDCAAQEDGNACNGTLFCNKASGLCAVNPATVVQCKDGIAGDCTVSTCQPATGLCVDVTATIGTPCDDDNSCTQAEFCGKGGVCAGGNNLCGCTGDADCQGFDDGNACNGQVFCNQQAFPAPQCQLTAAKDCPHGNCQTASCDPVSGTCSVVSLAEGLTCTDDNPCTTSDGCTAGQCSGKPANCDDNNPCTADVCAAGKCLHPVVANGLPCDDGDACTVVDACAAGVCSHQLLNCDDGRVCSIDTCEDGQCVYVDLEGTTCDDGDPCTTSDACGESGCRGQPIVCAQPTIACQQNTCEDGECVQGPQSDGATCELDDPCVLTAACFGGSCGITGIVACDDGNPCTTEGECVTGEGCPTAVDDGNPNVYWSSSSPGDGIYFYGLAQDNGQWATVGLGAGNDPILRRWQTAGAAPQDIQLSYPGYNEAYDLAADGQGGWLLAGQHGTGVWPHLEAGAQPLLMRVGSNGGLMWVSTNLVKDAVVYDIANELPDTWGRVVVAGVQGAAISPFSGKLWLAEVEIQNESKPIVHKTGSCSFATSGNPTGLYGKTVSRLPNGDWIVAGHTRSPGGQPYAETPVWCRFNSDLQLVHGPVLHGELDGGLFTTAQTIHPRQDGSFWIIARGNMASSWRVYDANNNLVTVKSLPGNGMTFADDYGLTYTVSDDSGSRLSYSPYVGYTEFDPVLLDLGGGDLRGSVTDPTGTALLFKTWDGEDQLRHTDSNFADTCGVASDCPNGCNDNNACTADGCSDGTCSNNIVTCDDNNPCTYEYCSWQGCEVYFADGYFCDDGDNCTANDSCTAGSCKGTERLGVAVATTAASETIVDAIGYGEGLLVVGNRENTNGPVTFWRRYSALGQPIGEGELEAGTAITLARSVQWSVRSGALTEYEPATMLFHNPFGGIGAVTFDYYGQIQATAQELSFIKTLASQPAIQTENGELYLYYQNQAGELEVSHGSVLSQSFTTLYTVPTTQEVPLALVPANGDWVLVNYSNNESLQVHFAQISAVSGAVVAQGSESVGSTYLGEDVFHGVTMAGGQVLVSCGEGTAAEFVLVQTGEYMPGDTVQMPDLTWSSPAQTHRNYMVGDAAGFAVSKVSEDGGWEVRMHDGFYNTTRTVNLSVGEVVAAAGSDRDIWLVGETVIGNNREVRIYHYDRYGNNSCSTLLGSGCFDTPCDDGQICTTGGCENGACYQTNKDGVANCGPDGPCPQMMCTNF